MFPALNRTCTLDWQEIKIMGTCAIGLASPASKPGTVRTTVAKLSAASSSESVVGDHGRNNQPMEIAETNTAQASVAVATPAASRAPRSNLSHRSSSS
jgi:hypothetical protein